MYGLNTNKKIKNFWKNLQEAVNKSTKFIITKDINAGIGNKKQSQNMIIKKNKKEMINKNKKCCLNFAQIMIY